MTYIEELQKIIKRLHGVDSTHVETVPIKETFQGQTVWEGEVEVFDLHGHPKTHRAYAWTHEIDDAKKRHITVLHLPPITSALEAVRASIVKDFREQEPES
jgi:hypothetical protein